MPYKRIALETRNEILTALKNGKSVTDAAKLFAVSEPTIYEWLSKDPSEMVSRLEYNKLLQKNEELLKIIGELTSEARVLKKKRRG